LRIVQSILVVVIAVTIACSPAVARRDEPGVRPASGNRGRPNIEQLAPARDSVGSAPARFAWTAIEGADSYAVGIWNEVDVLIWRDDHVPTNSMVRPESLQLEPGTYLWSVSALREGREIAESGLAAFVVRTAP
jgi:hypothetical protein